MFRKKLEQPAVRERLLSFGEESLVLQFAVQKYKGTDIQNYNFACWLVWVWNLVAHIEERRLRVFENGALRRVFGAERDGVTGEWRKLHNEELNDLCY